MAFINKISALFLVAICLIATTVITALLKFHLLFEHYCQHKAENINPSLVSCLKMHYEVGDVTNKEVSEVRRMHLKYVHHSTMVSYVSQTPPLFPLHPVKVAIKK